ncbi:DUF1580 domain-containing protein [Blastopirellula sp. J2-11]|uniref:DUF1580 domain-containing protein n=1 Tax=Blastopirellula sp. J2-11 TaxID=2943192 RepID=UPI0021C9D32E|nr:DUF1580 domain-containing protein [Blastopirellula sp. J2-11]UUO08096.1 DUF1580 domain-containing protein [Blastopirellula sp. J2-11]
MTTEFKAEEKIRLRKAAQFYPVKVCGETVRRHAQIGVNGLKLEAVRVGGRFFTSQGAVERFNQALNEPLN